jgi:transposase-like protein
VGKTRQTYTAELKTKVALEAIKGERSVNEIASRYGVHPNLVGIWKRQAVEGMSSIFRRGSGVETSESEALQSRLYEQIGQLKVELDWLKKKWGVLERR